MTRPAGLPILWRTTLRHLLRRRAQGVLAVSGVALGVAVLVAVDLASASAGRAFQLSTEAAAGRATHQIVGGPDRLPDALLARLVTAGGVVAAPVVEDYVTVVEPGTATAAATAPGGQRPAAPRQGSPAASPPPGTRADVGEPAAAPRGGRDARPPRTLHLLGVDPFLEGPVRPELAAGGSAAAGAGSGDRDGDGARGATGMAGGPAALLVTPGACLLSAPTAEELGLKPGGDFQVRAGGTVRRMHLAGVLRARDADARRAIADLAVVDIATAQELLGREGRIDRIDLRLASPAAASGGTPGATDAPGAARELRRIAALLPPGAQLLDAGERARGLFAMTRAFRVNLAALSLLTLLCGAFLIYNTTTFSVVQRRPLLATLRTLGVTRGQVLGLVLGEAAALAMAGTALGLVGGVLLGRLLLGLVTRTINDLYFVLAVRDLALPASSFLKGAALGLGATLAAALPPAIEAAVTPPRAAATRSLLEARLAQALPRATLLGCCLLAAGGGVLMAPGLVPGFAGLGAVTVGFALLSPAATVGLMRLLRPPLGALLGWRGKMAASGVTASLSRTAVAIAALMIAVSVTVGVGVMIDSFRHTFVRWLDGELQADVYVAAAGGGVRGGSLPPDFAARAAAVPGVAAVHAIRRTEIATPGGPIRLVAIDNDRHGWNGLELREGDPGTVWRLVATGDQALVSEPFSRRHDLHAGGHLLLPTAAGPQRLRIAGVFYDYASDVGVVMIGRRNYLRLWHDPELSAMSADLAPGADMDRTIARLRQALGSSRPLVIQSNRALKRASLAIFDRTFLITGVLRLLAGLVAAIGVLSALTALQLERAREIGVLRATGLTPAQVWQLITTQTGLMGLAAGLMSLPAGLVLSAIMVYVINRRSFGWSIRLDLAPAVLLEALLLAVGTAVAAGLYPAWRMARTPPALALREE